MKKESFTPEKNTVYYIGYYSDENNEYNRIVAPSAVSKMSYIAAVIEKIGYNVHIVSCAPIKAGSFTKRIEYDVSNGIYVTLLPSFPQTKKIFKAMQFIMNDIWLNLYLLATVKKGSTIVKYHSTAGRVYHWVKRIKDIRFILELEEIYSDVSGNTKQREKELQFAELADAYIFPTQLLDTLVNTKKKPSVIIHGTYQVEPDRECNVLKPDLRENSPKMIHCVYAGTLDPRKGGAVAAAAAEFLPENYHIHILGFGSERQIQETKDRIADIASRSKAKVTYDGLLSGEAYIRFIQSCDIGLSTQNPDASFNATSFPSKILSYMANGLRVVSIRIPAIEQSHIGKYVYYYDKQTPREIAQAILSTDLSDDYDGREIVKRLDRGFTTELAALLQNT